ncbi:hypothetical protein ACL9RL_02510 [Plantibacter sp. Mn2098]|uniref:hypothetical protein n=1 Tax=Plantibacter sp. Mn2098 TaxID=3395266 RepID=UPI003BDAABD3
MNEQEPSTRNPERLVRTAGRYEQQIVEGIATAKQEQREIDEHTARQIAHVLGRAVGRASALAEYGRAGYSDGCYEPLREEYLDLYIDPTTPPGIREWIDWFGTHVIARERTSSGRQFMNDHLPPTLQLLLVETSVTIGEQTFTVHIPADRTQTSVDELRRSLEILELSRNDALQAFLSLSDVDATSPDLIESFDESYVGTFDSVEAALRGLMEVEVWEADLQSFASERGLLPGAVTLDLRVIEAQTREIYDLVEHKGAVYAFNK